MSPGDNVEDFDGEGLAAPVEGGGVVEREKAIQTSVCGLHIGGDPSQIEHRG